MKPHIKDTLIGLVVGFIATAMGTYFYITFFSEYGVRDSLRLAASNNLLGKLISLGAILNLLAFFVFIKKQQNNRARGVLFATIIVAFVILLYKIS